MEYMLVEGLGKDDIERQIQAFLEDGWTLEGPIVVSSSDTRFRLFQAMVRHSNAFVGVMPETA